VELALERQRILNGEAAHIEDVIAVVGDKSLAPYRPRAVRLEPSGDQGACHRDYLYRQRKSTQRGDELALVDDADETAGRSGDDLLARERTAAAFDEVMRTRGFIGSVDIERQIGDVIEVEHGDAGRLQERCAGVGAR